MATPGSTSSRSGTERERSLQNEFGYLPLRGNESLRGLHKIVEDEGSVPMQLGRSKKKLSATGALSTPFQDASTKPMIADRGNSLYTPPATDRMLGNSNLKLSIEQLKKLSKHVNEIDYSSSDYDGPISLRSENAILDIVKLLSGSSDALVNCPRSLHSLLEELVRNHVYIENIPAIMAMADCGLGFSKVINIQPTQIPPNVLEQLLKNSNPEIAIGIILMSVRFFFIKDPCLY